MPKNCKYSGKIFEPRRQNQFYENRSVQILANNAKARAKRQAKAPTDKVLDKNRTVLMRILEDQEQVVKSRDFLLGAGFNFTFFSSSLKFENKPCQVIYEFMIYSNGDSSFTIRKITAK